MSSQQRFGTTDLDNFEDAMELAESHLKRVMFRKNEIIEDDYVIRMQVNTVMVTVRVEKMPSI